MVAVPVAALIQNFSSRPLTAPAPFGTETDGRRSAAPARLSVPAGAALFEDAAGGPAASADRPGAPAGQPAVPEEAPVPNGSRPLLRSSGLACVSVITGRPASGSQSRCRDHSGSPAKTPARRLVHGMRFMTVPFDAGCCLSVPVCAGPRPGRHRTFYVCPGRDVLRGNWLASMGIRCLPSRHWVGSYPRRARGTPPPAVASTWWPHPVTRCQHPRQHQRPPRR
jgi:hypothetical protein